MDKSLDWLTIREANESDLKQFHTIINAEGWNPACELANLEFLLKQQKIFIAFDKQKPSKIIAILGALLHSPSYAWIGIYICVPAFRGRGIGYTLWKYVLEQLPPGTNVGLDGVPDQEPNYKKSGFKSAAQILRHEIFPSAIAQVKTAGVAKLVDNSERAKFVDVCVQYDAKMWKDLDRSDFMRDWVSLTQTQLFIYPSSNGVSGFCLLRPATTGYKIGPLLADNQDVALDILHAVAKYLEKNGEERTPIYLDVPNFNEVAMALVKTIQGKPMFSCARMYKGQAPQLNSQLYFGATSLELTF